LGGTSEMKERIVSGSEVVCSSSWMRRAVAYRRMFSWQGRGQSVAEEGGDGTLTMAMVEGFSHSKISCVDGGEEDDEGGEGGSKTRLVALEGADQHGPGVDVAE
jgi:hypothetical protein